MKIYTKAGDRGLTGLYGGNKVSKNSSYIAAYGEVDELNSIVGYCASACDDMNLKKVLLEIQHDLHSVCSDLSTPLDANTKIDRISADKSKKVEALIDQYENELEPLKEFILAGGCELAARLHIARTVARRAERHVVSHSREEKMNQEVLIYLNRLSDLLFVMARVANKRAGIKDTPWKP